MKASSTANVASSRKEGKVCQHCNIAHYYIFFKTIAEFMEKPVRPSLLLEKISKVIGQSSLSQNKVSESLAS